jgi:hypothetical protein
LLLGNVAIADEKGNDKQDDQQARNDRFEKMLSGVKLVGSFTIAGKEDQPLHEEEYTIRKVEKLDEGDYWRFWARIKYGTQDYEVPLPLQVKWVDDTPMITLTKLMILNQGPFSARVIFYDEMYAGTWSHGQVRGHLFGKIVKIEEAEKSGGEEKSKSGAGDRKN